VARLRVGEVEFGESCTRLRGCACRPTTIFFCLVHIDTMEALEARIAALEQANRQLLQRFDAMAAFLDTKNEDFKSVLARAEVSTYSEIVADVARHYDAFVCRH